MKKLLVSFILLLTTVQASAHERWINHKLNVPANESIFNSVSLDTISVVGRALFILVATMIMWSMREKIKNLIMSVVSFSNKKVQLTFELGMNFIFGGPTDVPIFRKLGEMSMRFAMMVPALVLIYSAAGHAIMMPSFPIPETSPYLGLFQFGQALLAVMIIMQFALPYVGMILFAVMAFCFGRYGAWVAVDGLPIMGIAYMYLTKGSKLSEESRIVVVRNIVGLSFFLLGVMKIVNHNLTLGVADQWPDVMKDPMIQMFWYGTNPAFAREWWCFGFGVSEMMTGLLIAFGPFRRPLSLLIAFEFTSLMVFHFGWPEFPHFFPIAILLLISFPRVKQTHHESIQIVTKNSEVKRD